MTSRLNCDLLNQVKNFVIKHANENNIVLADEFESQDAFKKFIISLTITSAMELCGLEMPEAYDLVMGDGSYEELANDVWEQLNAA